MDRWELLYAAGSVASLFVPMFFACFSAVLTPDRIRAVRARRIAEYRRSPESRLLRLTC